MSVAIFGVTFLFSRLFFFFTSPSVGRSLFVRETQIREGILWMALHFFSFFFFFSSRARNVSWERFLSLDPLEIAGTIKRRRRYRGRVTRHRDLRDIHHSQPEGNEERQSIDPARESSEDLLNEGRNDTIQFRVKRENILSCPFLVQPH